MKKILTISIAAYNMEKYLKVALDSLIIENMDLLEVLIIDDGSTDKTLKIAQEYEKKYPNTFKAIHKENGGYGSTINTAIKLAKGKYFKQLDGDDWYHTENLNKICMELLNIDVDVVYTPYIIYYQKNNKNEICRSSIEKNISEQKIEKAFENTNNEKLLMHTIMYKTEILKKNNILIEEKCFYTDNEYAFYPFFYAKTIKIFDIPLYIYRIGREGQSISKKNIIKNYKDSIKVGNNLLKRSKDLENLGDITKEYLEDGILKYLRWCICDVLIYLKPTKEHFEILTDYISNIKETDINIYIKLINIRKLIKILSKKNIILYKLLYYYIKFKDILIKIFRKR